MGNIRGITLASAVKYLQQNYGEEELSKVVSALDFDEQAVVTTDIQPLAWYPARVFNHLIIVADKICGKGDYGICHKIGGFIGEQTFTGIYKLFIERGNPEFVIRKTPLVWWALNDTGKAEVSKQADKYVKGRIIGYDQPHKAFCQTLAGYMARILEISGANNVQIVETKCRCDGADYCEYEVRWE